MKAAGSGAPRTPRAGTRTTTQRATSKDVTPKGARARRKPASPPAPEPVRPRRGVVYRAGGPAGARAVVVVSNDLRNGSLDTVLAARVTSRPMPSMPSIVELPIGEPIAGRVVCDQIAELPAADLGTALGSLSGAALAAVDDALTLALGLR